MGALDELMTNDHEQIEAWLRASVATPVFDAEPFERARSRLLRHIAVEEKVLFADARRRREGVPLDETRTLRVEHGAIALLLVPTPDHALVSEILALLETHDAREEGENGVYAACERLAGEDVPALVERALAYPAVPVAAHFDGHGTVRTGAEALAISGKQRATRTR